MFLGAPCDDAKDPTSGWQLAAQLISDAFEAHSVDAALADVAMRAACSDWLELRARHILTHAHTPPLATGIQPQQRLGCQPAPCRGLAGVQGWAAACGDQKHVLVASPLPLPEVSIEADGLASHVIVGALSESVGNWQAGLAWLCRMWEQKFSSPNAAARMHFLNML